MSKTGVSEDELSSDSEYDSGSVNELSSSESEDEEELEYGEVQYKNKKKPNIELDTSGKILSKTSVEKITIEIPVTRYYNVLNYWENKYFEKNVKLGDIVSYYDGQKPEVIIGYSKDDYITLPTFPRYLSEGETIYANEYYSDALEYISGRVDIKPVLKSIGESIARQYENLNGKIKN
uniref:Uncharacterized protein n=1 Tax=Moumouvirus sp. 'Monve' TaxID=1128131 RepID=H2EFB7_9VIRU|nr:hypothetical protein mv_R980 [Moumouvirus Monve]